MGNFISYNSSTNDISIADFIFIDDLIQSIGNPNSVKPHKHKPDVIIYKWDEIKVEVRKSDNIILCVHPID
jgi:hypothetical protein